MIITATEFKTNIGKYLTLVNEEEIIIAKNGKGILAPGYPDENGWSNRQS